MNAVLPQEHWQEHLVGHIQAGAAKHHFNKTVSNVPKKLHCGACGDLILRLQDEQEFWYCQRCWHAGHESPGVPAHFQECVWLLVR